MRFVNPLAPYAFANLPHLATRITCTRVLPSLPPSACWVSPRESRDRAPDAADYSIRPFTIRPFFPSFFRSPFVPLPGPFPPPPPLVDIFQEEESRYRRVAFDAPCVCMCTICGAGARFTCAAAGQYRFFIFSSLCPLAPSPPAVSPRVGVPPLPPRSGIRCRINTAIGISREAGLPRRINVARRRESVAETRPHRSAGIVRYADRGQTIFNKAVRGAKQTISTREGIAEGILGNWL